MQQAWEASTHFEMAEGGPGADKLTSRPVLKEFPYQMQQTENKAVLEAMLHRRIFVTNAWLKNDKNSDHVEVFAIHGFERENPKIMNKA